MVNQVVVDLSGAAELRRPTGRRVLWPVVLLLILAGLAVASVALGTRSVSLADVISALGGSSKSLGEAAVARRMPRTVLAIMVGAALAVSGASMQAITRNPLADPGILGVSTGAALAVAFSITFLGIADPYAWMAVSTLGAFGGAVLVYTVASLGAGGTTPLKLALSGAAVSAAFSSLLSAILLPRVDVLMSFRFWQIGGVGGATWDRLGVAAPFLALGLLICLLTSRGLNSLALGDEMAASLGVNVGRTRLVAATGAVILCGVATSIAGPIAFVGLVIPHLVRLLGPNDHRWLLPMSAIGGAALVVGADVIGRVVARPEEIEVGVITALIGAPVLIWVVSRRRLADQ